MKGLAALLLLLSCLAFPAGPSSAEEGTLLDLEACIALALANHPDLRSGAARTEGAEAVIRQKEAALRPTVELSSSFKEKEGSDSSTAEAAVNQLLSDGGRTKASIRIARYGRDGKARDLERTRQTVAYDVKEAYFGLLKARKDYLLALETAEIYREQLEKAKVSYETGTVARSDVTAAQVDLSQAELDVIKTRSSRDVAKAELSKSLGLLDIAGGYDIADVEDDRQIALSFEEAFARAREFRPDLKSLEFSLLEAEETVRYQSLGLNPQLSASGGYDWSDGSSSSSVGEWAVGLSLAIPLYDGGLTAAKTAEARASLAETQADYEAQLQQVALEVRTALLEIDEARQNIAATEMTVLQARENLDLSMGRYAVGVGYQLEVRQATEDYNEARKEANAARYDYSLALASLEKALGEDVATAMQGEGKEDSRG